MKVARKSYSGLCDGASGVSLRTGQIDMSRDLGYVPPGVIGDYIWFDSDGDGVQDAGEGGIGYVTVRLCSDANCNTELAKTQTDSDGYYSFGNLNDGTYYVQVVSSTLPSGVAPTYDLDGTGTPHITAVTLSGGGSNLTADFGYRYSGAYGISGHVFFDAGHTGDGTNDIYNGSEDTPYAGMTVYLWREGRIVGQTTTDSNGYYSFGNLPPGDYTVSVDRSGTLGLMAVTATPNTEVKSFNTVSITNSNITNQDFGFYAKMDLGDLPSGYNYTIKLVEEGPIHINSGGGSMPTIYLGTAWDSEPDGAPDTGAGMNGGTTGDDRIGADDEDGVIFLNAWVRGGTAQLRFVITDNDPTYTPYLVGWFDWNMDGDFYDAGEMVDFGNVSGTVDRNVSIPAGNNGNINMRFRLYATQSPPPVIAPTGTVFNGEVEDYQQPLAPTAVELSSFSASYRDRRVTVRWETASELDLVGFNIYRSTAENGPYMRLNSTLIPAQRPGSPLGALYTWVDGQIRLGRVYYYKLEQLSMNGETTLHGPLRVQTGTRVAPAPRPVPIAPAPVLP